MSSPTLCPKWFVLLHPFRLLERGLLGRVVARNPCLGAVQVDHRPGGAGSEAEPSVSHGVWDSPWPGPADPCAPLTAVPGPGSADSTRDAAGDTPPGLGSGAKWVAEAAGRGGRPCGCGAGSGGRTSEAEAVLLPREPVCCSPAPSLRRLPTSPSGAPPPWGGMLRAGPERGPQPQPPPFLQGWGPPPPCAALGCWMPGSDSQGLRLGLSLPQEIGFG